MLVWYAVYTSFVDVYRLRRLIKNTFLLLIAYLMNQLLVKGESEMVKYSLIKHKAYMFYCKKLINLRRLNRCMMLFIRCQIISNCYRRIWISWNSINWHLNTDRHAENRDAKKYEIKFAITTITIWIVILSLWSFAISEFS